MDACLVTNEIVAQAKKNGVELLLIKLDFEKAFDSAKWSFMFDTMLQMTFGQKWC